MLIFLLAASVVLYLFAWRMDVLERSYLTGAFALAGVVAQVLAPPFSATRLWMAAVNICFALYFAIRIKLSM